MGVCMSDQATSRTRETLTLRKREEYSTLEDYAYTVHFSRHLYLFIYISGISLVQKVGTKLAIV
jgi:predicted membrane chloride channel (bestrophin family)